MTQINRSTKQKSDSTKVEKVDVVWGYIYIRGKHQNRHCTGAAAAAKSLQSCPTH